MTSKKETLESHVDKIIAKEYYFLAGDGVYGDAHKFGNHSTQEFPEVMDRLTFCVLVLDSGLAVTGEALYYGSDKVFDGVIGRKIARSNAIKKLCELEMYRNYVEKYKYEKGQSQTV